MSGTDLFKQFSLPEPQPFGTKAEIYIAEAFNDLRLIMQHHLGKLGFHNVRASREGSVALAELKLKPADIVFGGDDLNGINGLDLIQEIRETPSIVRGAYVLITKAMKREEIMYAVEKGIDDLMVRPVAPSDIMPKLRSAYATFNNPKNPERLYEFAKAHLRGGDLDKAQEVYKALSQTAQGAARPLVGLARIEQGKNKLPEALRFVNEGLERNLNYVHAYTLRAEIHVAMGNNPQAIADLKKAIEISPLNIARYQGACELMLANNLIDDCITVLDMGVKAGLHDTYLIERLGFCHFSKQNYPAALKYLKTATRLDPENVSYLNSLAICCRDSKDFEGAIHTYNQILKKDPENHQVLFNKALVYIHLNKPEECVRLLRRVVKMKPDFEKAKKKIKELGFPLEDSAPESKDEAAS